MPELVGSTHGDRLPSRATMSEGVHVAVGVTDSGVPP